VAFVVSGWIESLRYLSLYDNRYLRYFKGHRDRSVPLQNSLSAHPFDYCLQFVI
jgi:hypothetical protein